MANLSNINGKFLFTDGDFLLIGGATANSISATESGVAIKNSNAATLSLQNSATNGKNHTLWSNTDGSFNITDVGVATRFTIASGGDVYIPSGNVSIGNTSVYPSGSNTILQIYSVSIPRLKLQNSTTGTASTDGSQFYVNGSDLNITNSESANIIFSTNAIERMRIDSSGAITTDVTGEVTIPFYIDGYRTGVQQVWLNNSRAANSSNGRGTKLILGAGNTVGAYFTHYTSGSTGNGVLEIGVQYTGVTTQSGLEFNTNSNRTVLKSVGSSGYTSFESSDGTERMRIDSSGNVQVGTDTPLFLYSEQGIAQVAANRVSSNGTIIDTSSSAAYINLYTPTAGSYMTFHTANAINTSPSERMRIASDGQVTVTGTSTTMKLYNGSSFTGVLHFGNADFLLGFDSGVFKQRIWDGADYFNAIEYNGSSHRLILAPSEGSVGIGTTSPGGNLEIKTLAGGSGVNTLRLNTNFSGGNTVDINPFISGLNNGGMEIKLAGSQKLVMLPSGDVGIGVTSPSSILDVSSGLSASNTAVINLNGASGAAAELVMRAGGDDNGTIYNRRAAIRYFSNQISTTAAQWVNGVSMTQTTGDDKFYFNNSSNSTVLCLQQNGNVVFGGGTFSSGSNKIQIAQSSETGYIQTSSNVATATDHRYFYNSNGLVGRIQTSGTSTSYVTSSDYRLKENVVEMTGALDRVSQLKPSRFNFIADADKTVDGFLAHEVQDIVPEAITGEKDGMRTEEYEVTPAVLDEEGNITEEAVMGTREVPDYQGIDQSKLVPLLVGAIQELKAEIELLKTQINN